MFHFKHFSLYHEKSTLPIGTDSVLLAAALPLARASRVLDIGCGCGVIAFCLAFRSRLAYPEQPQHIAGIDPDKVSIQECKANLSFFPQHKGQTFSFYHTDLQTFAQKENLESFDLIVSNPPFFSQSLKPDNEKKRQSKHSDGHLSFDGLIDNVLRLLSPGGTFHLILPFAESEQFKSLINNKLHLYHEITIHPKRGKICNRKIMSFSKRKPEKVQCETLFIREEDGSYSCDYQKLTDNFYL